MKKLLIVTILILMLLLPACNGGGTSSITSSMLTYSQVLQTYPEGVQLCQTVASAKEENGQLVVEGDIDVLQSKQRIRWYGAKITATTPVTVDGITFPEGALLTVDKDLNWVQVSSWD
jgi:hypothetical protein